MYYLPNGTEGYGEGGKRVYAIAGTPVEVKSIDKVNPTGPDVRIDATVKGLVFDLTTLGGQDIGPDTQASVQRFTVEASALSFSPDPAPAA